MKKLLIIALIFGYIYHSNAQKINPDLENIQVKNKSEIIYKSQNSSEDLKSVKSVIDSKGNQYVLFCDGNIGGAYLSTNSSGQWNTRLLPKSQFNDESVQYVAMDIDKNDGLHIVLVGYPGIMYYGYKKSGTDWKFTEISKDKMSWLHNFYIFQNYIDMAVDNQFGVHIIAKADIESKGYSSIYFYKPQNGKWTSEIIRKGINDTEKDYGNEPSIVIDGNKVKAAIGGNLSLSYAEKTIGSQVWDVSEILKDGKETEGQKLNTSIDLNSNGEPIISFNDYKYGDLRGVNILTKSKCTGKWDRESIGDESSSGSAIVSNNDIIFLAYCNDGGYTKVAYKTCECNQVWETVYNANDRSKIFMDMFVDSKKHTHLYYSTYEDEIKHVEFWFDGDPDFECNYRPSVYFKGKTNVQQGEEWSGEIYANDPECDPTEIYSIILPDGFEIKDHGNGSATVKGIVPTGTEHETGEIQLLVLCNDNKHSGPNGSQSKVVIKLKITPEGKEKGSIKYENNCKGKKNKAQITSKISTSEIDKGKSNETAYEETAKDDKSDETSSKLDASVSQTCSEYLDEYEVWANKYVPLKKRVNENSMDMDAVMKIANMASEMGNWAVKWAQLYECGQDEGFQTRYEKISDKIDEVNK